MLEFNANESYRLSICVDKSVFSTIESAQCDVQFYLVNSLLSKCLGTFTLGPPIASGGSLPQSHSHPGNLRQNSQTELPRGSGPASRVNIASTSGQLNGTEIGMSSFNPAAFLSENYRRAAEHHLRGKVRQYRARGGKSMPLKRRRVNSSVGLASTSSVQQCPVEESVRSTTPPYVASVSSSVSAPSAVSPQNRSPSIRGRVSRSPMKVPGTPPSVAGSSSQPRKLPKSGPKTQVNLVSDDEDFEIQEIGAPRDKTTPDGSSYSRQQSSVTSMPSQMSHIQNTPTKTERILHQSINLLGDHPARRVVKLPSSGDELQQSLHDVATSEGSRFPPVDSVEEELTLESFGGVGLSGLKSEAETAGLSSGLPSSVANSSGADTLYLQSHIENLASHLTGSLEEPWDSHLTPFTIENSANNQRNSRSAESITQNIRQDIASNDTSPIGLQGSRFKTPPLPQSQLEVVSLDSSHTSASIGSENFEVTSSVKDVVTSSESITMTPSGSDVVTSSGRVVTERELVSCELCEYQTPSLKRLRLHYTHVHKLS